MSKKYMAFEWKMGAKARTMPITEVTPPIGTNTGGAQKIAVYRDTTAMNPDQTSLLSTSSAVDFPAPTLVLQANEREELEQAETGRSVSPIGSRSASTDDRLSVGSLFSGVGGIDLGLERAGMRVLWQVEYDQQCQTVLRHRFPGTEIYGDVREVGYVAGDCANPERERSRSEQTGRSEAGAGGGIRHSIHRPATANRRTELAPVDLICGGFPCQDVSVAGNRAGLAGDRSGLWHEFHRIIGEVMPKWVLIENVPGLLSSNGGRDLAIVLSGLAQLGYGWSYRILDSQYFGVAQRRRRVFIVGCLGDAGTAFRALHPVGTGIGRNPAPSRETREGVADCAGASTDECGTWPDTAMPLMERDYKGPRNYQDGGIQNMCVAPLVARSSRGKAQPLSMGHNTDEHWVNQSVPRRLTPRECERLQGFPDDWTLVEHNGKPMSDGQRYRQMGNAVTVNVAEWIGRRILADE